MKIGVRHLAISAVGGIFIGLVIAGTLDAQQPSAMRTPGVQQTFLLNAPLTSMPGKQIDVLIGDFQPGARTPLHRHPGIELLYVLEGEGEMIISGRESLSLKEGSIVLVEPEVGEDSFVHAVINRSASEGIKTLVFVIHDEGTSIADPVSEDSQ